MSFPWQEPGKGYEQDDFQRMRDAQQAQVAAQMAQQQAMQAQMAQFERDQQVRAEVERDRFHIDPWTGR